MQYIYVAGILLILFFAFMFFSDRFWLREGKPQEPARPAPPPRPLPTAAPERPPDKKTRGKKGKKG